MELDANDINIAFDGKYGFIFPISFPDIYSENVPRETLLNPVQSKTQMFHVEHCKNVNGCCAANQLLIICRTKEKHLYKIRVLCYLHIFHCIQHHSNHLHQRPE